MKLDKKNLMIIGGVLLAVGIGVYFWRKRKVESEESETIDVDAVVVDDDGNEIKKSTSDSVSADDPRYNYTRSPLLSKIENKNVAGYLSNLLSQDDIYRLRSWLRLINEERAKDSSKWGDANGLKGQVSDVGHALFQMKKQNEKLGGKSKMASKTKGELWNNTIRTDLIDAQ